MEFRDVQFIHTAHQKFPVEEGKQYRKFDGKTPYYVHPLCCATLIASEVNLDKKTRDEGVLVLLYHDVLEDTKKKLPSWLSPRVKGLIQHMTFYGGNEEERKKIWKKPKVIKLYKLFDKVHNFLDSDTWMTPSKKKIYRAYIRKLAREVKKDYKKLNIVKIAESITK